eukprot:jgi/Chrpa1/2964/Chrysochromulina_OHIO_Genome00013545-RA
MPTAIESIMEIDLIPATTEEALRHMFRFFGFLVLSFLIYWPYESGEAFNTPVGGWDENRTAEAWGNFGWDWDWIDCTYFAMVTMTTIGYGDHPTLNQGLRIFTIFFALVGVLAIGSSVQRVASWFNEQGRLHFIEMQKRTLDKAKKASSLVKEKKLGEAKSATGGGEGATGHGTSPSSEGTSPSKHGLFQGDPAPPPSPPPSPAAQEAQKKGSGIRRLMGSFISTGGFFAMCIILGEVENAQIEGCGGFGAGWSCGGTNECEAWKLAAGDAGPAGGPYCWTWIDEFYYALITFLTIGYGDVHAHTKGGKILATIIALTGILCFTALAKEIHAYFQEKQLGTSKSLRQRLVELNEVVEQDENGKVTPEEYVIFSLKKMGKVDKDLVNLLKEQFKALDMDGSGELDGNDVAKLAAAAEANFKAKHASQPSAWSLLPIPSKLPIPWRTSHEPLKSPRQGKVLTI